MRAFFSSASALTSFIRVRYFYSNVFLFYYYFSLILIALFSIQSKVDSLPDIIKDNTDILMIPESKVDYSFLDDQFFLDGFGTLFRLDRNANGGGIMLLIRNDIRAKAVSTDGSPIESFYVELNFRKKK